MLPIDSPHGHKQLLTFYTTKFYAYIYTPFIINSTTIILSNTLKLLYFC